MIFEESYDNYKIYLIDKELLDLVPQIIEGNVEIFKEFKVTKRNYVVGINYKNKKYILKSPRNEHRIPQRKVQTLIKDGEVLTTLKNINNLIDLGFGEFVKPLMAIVKRKYGMIVESYLLMEYVEGNQIKEEEIHLVVNFGKRLHNAGYYHGDFNASNFSIESGKLKVYDTQGKKAKFGSYRKHYDISTLSCDLLINKLGIDVFKEFNYKKDTYYYMAIAIKGLKNLPFISKFKEQKRKLRDKGWKM